MRFIKKIKFELIFVILFVLTRLPDLGYDVFNTDAWKWKARTYDFGTGVFTLNFEKTIQKYHPGVTLMWLGTAAVKVYNFYSRFIHNPNPSNNPVTLIFQLHFIQKLTVVLAIAISLAYSLFVLRKLFGNKKAFLIITILSFEPFYVALTRVFHLEGLMSTFMLSSYLWLYLYVNNRQNKKYLITSSVFAGLGILTKTSAIFMLPYAGLILFLDNFKDKNIKSFFKEFLIWVFGTAATFFILWPAMWTHAGEALSVMYRGVSEIGIEREHIQFYFGKLVEDPGITYYPVVLALRSSPLLIIGILGLLIFWKKIFVKGDRKFLLYSLFFVFFYLVMLTIPTKKLDRYILPDILVLSVLTTIFWVFIIDKIRLLPIVKYLALVLLSAAPLFALHPDYLSYYNPIFGGLKTGIRVLEPKWMIGGREITAYFDDAARKENLNRVYGATSLEEVTSGSAYSSYLTVGFQEKYYTQIFPFFRLIGGYAVVEDLTPFAQKTKYFVYPVWDDISKDETRFKLEFQDVIKERGVDIYKVYKRVE